MFSILIAEDEDIIRAGLRTIVEKFDIPFNDVYEAGNGKEAADLHARYRPDMVLTDIVMPDMNGLDFIAEIKRDDVFAAEVVIISGYGEFEYAQRAMRLGVSNYLLKPVVRQQLYEALCEMMEKIRKRRREVQVYDGPTGDIIDYALQYIHTHYARALDLETISRELQLNPNYFSGLFKKRTQENFTIYLQKLRIEHAQRLLADPLLRIYQVAEKVGFDDDKYFCKIFKRYTKYTPGQYRNLINRHAGNKSQTQSDLL